MEETFLCRDPRTNRGLISPRGNSPILFGVRSQNQTGARRALDILLEDCSEIIGYRIFCTNQATGDHIDETRFCTVHEIKQLKGGHIIINNEILCFSDSGNLNLLSQWLEPEDKIEYMGLEFEGKVHLEAMRVIESKQKTRPMCGCGTRMKSMGQNKGSRCPKCKSKSNVDWIFENREPLFLGWIQPPYDKRRHLAKDLAI